MSENRRQLRHGIAVPLGVLVACLGPGASGSSAGPKTVKHCITPTDIDLSERYGVSDAIVAPFCAEVNSGRRWTVSNAWFMNVIYGPAPPGFVPEGGDTAR